MKYYCRECGCVVDDRRDVEFIKCPTCPSNAVMERLPDYETPEQYQERTGEAWPEQGPVWFKSTNPDTDFAWGVCRYITAKKCGNRIIVCIQGPNPPPDDWMPEER